MGAAPDIRVDHHVFSAFGGSRCEIAAAGDLGVDAVSAAVADVYAFEQRLSRFRPDSELSLLNAGGGKAMAISPLLEAVLRAAITAWELSDGLVDAAVLPALVAAGYDVSIEEVRRRDADGCARGTATRGACPVLPDALEIGDGWARVRPGCAVDLGGIGKGWLADRLAERLGDAAVSLGGDVRILGDGPEGRGWTVELCDGSRIVAGDAAVATSGTEGRRWGAGRHHLIDPRSGRPAATDVAAVSVVAADAASAETLAKAAAILGSVAGVAYAHERGAARVAVRR